MKYLKSKLRAISREYTRRNRDEIIAAAGNKCPMCGRKNGDKFLFGPTNYLKQQIKFSVVMDIHVIDGLESGQKLLVICNGCHLSYHLFNRLSEDAAMGGKKLSDTLYNRCHVCKELSCACCKKCRKLTKWCACSTKKRKRAVIIRRGRQSSAASKKFKLRSK